MIGYRMDVATAEEMAAQDPFGGRGVFLPMEASGEDILGELDRVLGTVPSVAWPMRGAWVQADETGFSAAELQARWGGR